MNESFMSANERYTSILDKLDSIRGNIHLIHADELDVVMKEVEKLEAILKQLEDLYSQEIDLRTI